MNYLKPILIILLIVFIYDLSSANIINIPDDYSQIQQGIDASYDGDTVLVQPGTYVENINFNGHNIVLGSLYLITGDTTYIERTIIDGDSSGSVVIFESGEDSTAIITGFVIQKGLSTSIGGGISCTYSDPTITYNHIRGNFATGSIAIDGTGGGIYCFRADVNISHNVISGNVALGFWTYGYGGGIYCYGSNAIISNNHIFGNHAGGEWGYGGGVTLFLSSAMMINNVIAGNSALHWGGGIYCYESSPIITNNVISANSAWRGGGIHCELVSNPVITNTILWADSAEYGIEIDLDDSSSPHLAYCDIQGGWPDEGNIDVDPLFRDPGNGDFHLMAIDCDDQFNSPCIDMGDPDMLDILLECDWGLGELRSDMGAYGGGDSAQVGIENETVELPRHFALMQNYPNPFNPLTTIKYELSNRSQVTLCIYDVLGRRVTILQDGFRQAGYHQVIWNSRQFSSGMYICKLQVGDYTETKKMLLVK